MSKQFSFVLPVLIVFVVIQHCVRAQSLIGPLLPASTEVDLLTTVITKFKGTPCFTTIAAVTECRRKRGIEEKALIFQVDQSEDIYPSQVLAVETTSAPRVARSHFNEEMVSSSIEEVYYDSYMFFRQLSALMGRQGNVVTINPASEGGCVGPVNFSKFLSCIGFNVQNTDTQTSWFTRTTTITSGYSAIFVAGCTPPFFPYPLCTF